MSSEMPEIKDNDDAEDLLQEIYDEKVPQHSVISKRDFKPWHNPRKHWVRIHQLCSLAQRLFKDIKLPDDTVRYLTLPGEELLDIQALQAIAKAEAENPLDIQPPEITAKAGTEELLDIQAVQGTLEKE